MATSKEIRLENLRQLVREFETIELVGQKASTNPVYLSQILNGVKSSTGTARGVGEALARKLEKGCGKEVGWMDRPHQDLLDPARKQAESDVEDAPAIMRKPQLIPVVGRVQAGDDGLLHIDDFSVEHPEGYLTWYATCPDAYALRIRGESMSPRYLPGEFAGVDPCSEVQPSDEVIVFLKDGRRMIKRFLWERDGQACYESVNKNFPNIIFDCEEIEKMHRVTGHIDRSAFRPNI